MQPQTLAALEAAPTPKEKAQCRTRGPYADRNRWRLTFIEGKQTWSEIFETRAAALAAQRAFDRRHAAKNEITVENLCARYVEFQVRKGSRPAFIRHASTRLRLFFEATDLMALPIAALTHERARAAYDEYTRRPKAKGKGTIAVATHQEDLNVARCCFAWAMEEGLLEKNPFGMVRPIGRKNRGKRQLSLDSAIRFLDVAADEAAVQLDPLALATCVVVATGARNMEVMGRRVRELDEGGTKLRVFVGKTDNAKRPLAIPAKFVPMIRALAAGRPGDALLFAPDTDGKPPPSVDALSHRLLRKVEALCEKAGVERVVPHSFRGLWATIGVAETGDPDLIARKLGHGSRRITEQNYIDHRVAGVAHQERVQARLGLVAPPPGPIQLTDLTEALEVLTENLTVVQMQKMVQHLIGLIAQKASAPGQLVGSKSIQKRLPDRSKSNAEQVGGPVRKLSAESSAERFLDED